LAELTGTAGDPEKYLTKLGSLIRLAHSAGGQKREFLRRLARSTGDSGSSSASTGFRLDRSVLIVVPVGLDRLVQMVTGHGMTHGGPALEFGRRVVQRIRDVLRENARSVNEEACLDGPTDGRLDLPVNLMPSADRAAGLTPWDPNAA